MSQVWYKNKGKFCANRGTKVTMRQTGSNMAKKPRQSAWLVPDLIVQYEEMGYR